MTAGWERALADCEARLDAAASALAAGRPVAVEPFVAPAVAMPLPADLADRARALAARTEELGARLADELERVRDELRRIPRIPRAQRAPNIDTRA